MEIYYFSGTGNSLYIAKKIQDSLDNKVTLISLDSLSSSTEILPKSKNIGFIFPVYFGDIPKFVKSIIKKFNLSNVEYIFVIPNCYSVVGATFINFRKIVKSTGKNIDYENVLYMPDNAILFPVEKDIEKLKEMESTILPIIEDIKNRRRKVKFSTKYFQVLQYYFMKIFSEYEFSPKKFQVNDNCISCGICTQICPTKNISLNNGKPIFSDNCTHCLSCFHWCPKEAISMKNFVIKNRRKYHNPHVSLKDILKK